MGSGNITEFVRDLEIELKEKQAILKYYQRNLDHKQEVDRTINNEGMNLKIQQSPSGNAWAIAENLRDNIGKIEKEIKLYENINKFKPRFYK